jgi:hypothetical protein
MAAAAMATLMMTPKPFSLAPLPGGFGRIVTFRVFIQSGNDVQYRAI